MKAKHYTVAIMVVLIASGCGHYQALKKDFGNSYYSARNGQILNPAASANPIPATGLSGRAGEAAMKKYADSFTASGQASQTPQSFAVTPIVPTEGAGTGQNVYGK